MTPMGPGERQSGVCFRLQLKGSTLSCCAGRTGMVKEFAWSLQGTVAGD